MPGLEEHIAHHQTLYVDQHSEPCAQHLQCLSDNRAVIAQQCGQNTRQTLRVCQVTWPKCRARHTPTNS
eukprot:736306-Amphidinium_carterae.2